MPAARTVELLGRIREGDATAWDELYRAYHDELLFVARMNLGNKLRSALDSEDVLQSAALEAFRALPRFEYREEGGLRRFLHRLVVNKIRDRADTHGAQKRAGAVQLTDTLMRGLAGSGEPTYASAKYEQLERCLGRLPEEMRRVILLRKIEGYSSKEAAEHMGATDAATRKLYSRAMAKLASLMHGDGGG